MRAKDCAPYLVTVQTVPTLSPVRLAVAFAAVDVVVAFGLLWSTRSRPRNAAAVVAVAFMLLGAAVILGVLDYRAQHPPQSVMVNEHPPVA